MSAEEAMIPAVCYAGPADGERLECEPGTDALLLRVRRGGVLCEVHAYRFANRTEKGRWVFAWDCEVGAQGFFSEKKGGAR